VFIIMRHSLRTFVSKLDFLTTLGHGASGTERKALGLAGGGPALLVTDLCIMRPDGESNEFVVGSLHPGVTRDQVCENTAWPVRFAEGLEETPAPTALELEVLRDLNARTTRAHGGG